MRKLAILLMLLVPVMAVAKHKHKRKKHRHKHKKEQPIILKKSRWMETKRMAMDSTFRAFNDTIHIEFLDSNKYVLRRAGGFIYKGKYTRDGNELEMGLFNPTLLQKKYGKLLMKDDSSVYFFEPDTSKLIIGNKQIKMGQMVDSILPVTSIDQMVGHWSVYRRTSKASPNDVDYTRIIKMIDITGGSSDGKLGYVYAAKDPEGVPSWGIKTFANGIMECDGKDKRTFKIVKCQDKELVLEEDDMTYYFKEFK
jgi:hypothetical protein